MLYVKRQGIEAEDAVYLPAVETALSLVHDVHPRVGESVVVFGQGMIGWASRFMAVGGKRRTSLSRRFVLRARSRLLFQSF